MLTAYKIKDSALADKAEPIIVLKNKIKKGSFGDVSEELTKDLSIPIPRDEITKHFKYIKSLVPSAIICGSYRREKMMSADMDIIVQEPIESVLKKLSKKRYIRGVFVKGIRKMICVVKIGENPHRQLDIIYANDVEYPFSVLYFTGSKRNNIKMRIHAKKMKLKLNQYGLFYTNSKRVPNIKTEHDIFDALKLPYKEPKDR